MRVDFSLTGTPQGNQRARSTARAYLDDIGNPQAIVRVYSDAEMVAAQQEVARLYKIAAGGRKIITGPVQIILTAVFEVPESWPRKLQRLVGPETIWHVGRPDIDNILKLVMDGLNKVAWVDDGQVASVTKCKRYGGPPRVDVAVVALPQSADAVTPGQRRLEKRIQVEGIDKVLAGPARTKKPSKAEKPAPQQRMTAEEYRKLNPRRSRAAEELLR